MISNAPTTHRNPWPAARVFSFLLLFLGACCVSAPARGQQPAPPSTPAGTPQSWVDASTENELKIVAADGSFPLRYRVHKSDAKGDVVRETIETRQGSVARLIERNGQPLTAAEDAAERDRLQAILDSPGDFLRHHKRDNANRDDMLQLVKLMPRAMLYTYAPGQPQPPNATSPQIVLDFTPNPAFKPPSMAADILTGLQGRLWIDAQSLRLTRAEARVLHPVNFGWGIVGRIFPGGTVEFEQTSIAPDRWVYAHLDTHLTLRVVVKTVAMNDKMTASNFELLPNPLSVQEAVHQLLAMQIPLR